MWPDPEVDLVLLRWCVSVNTATLDAKASQRPQVLCLGQKLGVVLNVIFALGGELHLELHTTYQEHSESLRRRPLEPSHVRVTLRAIDAKWQHAMVHVGATADFLGTADHFTARLDGTGSGPFEVTVESGGTGARIVSAPVQLKPIHEIPASVVLQYFVEAERDGTAVQRPAVAGIPERVYQDESIEVLRAPVIALGRQLHVWYLLQTHDYNQRLIGPQPNLPFTDAELVADNNSWFTRFQTGTGDGGETGESYAWVGRRDQVGPEPFRIVSTFRRWGGTHTSPPTRLEPLALPDDIADR